MSKGANKTVSAGINAGRINNGLRLPLSENAGIGGGTDGREDSSSSNPSYAMQAPESHEVRAKRLPGGPVVDAQAGPSDAPNPHFAFPHGPSAERGHMHWPGMAGTTGRPALEGLGAGAASSLKCDRSDRERAEGQATNVRACFGQVRVDPRNALRTHPLP